jgi:hypothetical protein
MIRECARRVANHLRSLAIIGVHSRITQSDA